MNESPAFGLAAVQAGHSERDRRGLGRVGKPNGESLDLDNMFAARLPAALVPSRPTANGPNGLPIVMSSASEYRARDGSTSPLMMAARALWLASMASLSCVS